MEATNCWNSPNVGLGVTVLASAAVIFEIKDWKESSRTAEAMLSGLKWLLEEDLESFQISRAVGDFPYKVSRAWS